MSLASALSNVGSVMLHADTQYLSQEFGITCDVTQKAPLEVLVNNLQKIFHNCKEEADRLNIAKKILVTLGVIASKQGSSEEQAHFSKIKEIVLSALSSQGQIVDKISRAQFFQDKLILLLYAKKLMTTCGKEAHAGICYMDSERKCLDVFEKQPLSSKSTHCATEYYAYHTIDDTLPTVALSALLRIRYLTAFEGFKGTSRTLTKEELLELESYRQHENAQIKKIANDYTLLRKLYAAAKPYNKIVGDFNALHDIGTKNALLILKNKVLEPSQKLSDYYPAFDKYVNFSGTNAEVLSLTELTVQKGFYEEHLTQLPAVHFAYRYFYNELLEVCSLFSNRITSMGYKKAYDGYEGNVLPSPEAFQAIEAVFTEPDLPVAIQEEKKEVFKQTQPISIKKSKPDKSKKNHSPPKHEPRPQKKIKVENVQTPTSSSIKNTVQANAAVTLKKDTLPFKEIVYDPRVSLWATNPDDCLSLPSYASLSEKNKEIVVYKHAFPNALDQLVGTAYSLQETYENSKQKKQIDILFSIPGEIECLNSSMKIRGLFQYCFGEKDKVCYHRYFKEMSTQDLLKLDQYSKVFEEVEFPPLSSHTASATPAKKSNDQELSYEPTFNSYAVTDKTKGLIFRAFKIR